VLSSGGRSTQATVCEEAVLKAGRKPRSWFDLSIFAVFGLAAAIMAPVSFSRGNHGEAVFWLVQLLAMGIGFARNLRRFREAQPRVEGSGGVD
jgi:hypothetical protein